MESLHGNFKSNSNPSEYSNTEEPNLFPLNITLEMPFDVPKWLKKISVPSLLCQQQAFNQVKFCVTDGCSETSFQWCHVIPMRSQLSSFAEDGKVCWIPMREHDRWTLRSWWSEDPISKTLVFRGFCNKCDSSIFSKIDRPIALDDESFLLLAFRAACYFNWRAEVNYRASHLLPEKIQEMAQSDPEIPPLQDRFELALASQIESTKLQRNVIKQMTESIRDAVVSGAHNIIRTKVYDINTDLPVRFSLAGCMVTSLRHEHIHISQIECPLLPAFFFHLLDVDGSTKLIFSCLDCIPEHFSNAWIEELEIRSNSGHLADVLLRFMFINNHGLVFKPSLVHTFSHEQAAYLTSPLSGKMYFDAEPQITRICEPPYFDLNWQLTPLI